MDRKLNKKELKFLQKLGINANENSSIAQIQSLLKRDENQNVPNENESNESDQDLSDKSENPMPKIVPTSTIALSSAGNQNIPIASPLTENVQQNSDKIGKPTPSSVASVATTMNSDEKQNIPILQKISDANKPFVPNPVEMKNLSRYQCKEFSVDCTNSFNIQFILKYTMKSSVSF